jgi:hypothetical protein
MSRGERRVRVTVTLSPHLIRLVDERARLRPDKSRSATIEAMLERADLEERVREYYSAPDAERDADDEFWEEVQQASAALDAKAAAPQRKRGRR